MLKTLAIKKTTTIQPKVKYVIINLYDRSSFMKCVKIKGVKDLVTDSLDKPQSENGSVIIKVESCGICGSDIHNWDLGAPVDLVLGHEFSGTVENPGNREDLKIGDRVTGLPISPCNKCDACLSGNYHYCPNTWTNAVGLSLENSGGYAEYLSCRSDMVRLLPEEISFDEAAMIEPSAVALHATNLADIKVGDKVLVIGAGIIGLMACEFAKLEGASYVCMIETNMLRAKKSVTIGKANEYYDALDENTIPKLLELTKGGFDKIIECCGNGPAVTEAIMATRKGGKIILVGVSTEPITIPTVVSVMSEISMIGSIAYTPKEFDNCIELIANKRLNVKKYIDDVIPLEKAQEAFLRLTSNESDAVKILFHPKQ